MVWEALAPLADDGVRVVALVDRPEAFAAGVTTLLAADEAARRAAARARAEQFGWPAAVAGMLGTLAAS
ncbi:hypothetical protein GCM10009559_01510 [Pseudonocardia zijingensis]|uniref:Glycosyl transferase family 1 n=1 Tax=Pseudonocardia zijingensis TaxID=153376 RepID=A0ABN1NYW9_9PSEU